MASPFYILINFDRVLNSRSASLFGSLSTISLYAECVHQVVLEQDPQFP